MAFSEELLNFLWKLALHGIFMMILTRLQFDEQTMQVKKTTKNKMVAPCRYLIRMNDWLSIVAGNFVHGRSCLRVEGTK